MLESQFPAKYDDDSNLLLAKDYLKVKLAQDYNPGDSVVTAESSVGNFPPQGIITIIDNCAPEQVTSLYYEERADNQFTKLTPTEGTKITFKSKLSSIITQQLDAMHHNNIKDAIIAIQKFLGTIKDESKDTLFGRLNWLKKIVFAPRAWFEVDLDSGLAPFTVQFTNKSIGTTGPVGEVIYTWDFGDGTKLTEPSGNVAKTYTSPGLYTVALEIESFYGKDKIELQDFIKVKPPAPNEATVKILAQPGQHLIGSGVRTTTNQLVLFEIPEGKNPDNPKFSLSGEILDEDGKPIDPIVAYTWQTAHGIIDRSANQAKASYDAGGLFDVVLRVDTDLGAYRITNFPKMVDVIEPVNLWLWTLQSPGIVSTYEYGLISETFKMKQYNQLTLKTNDSFLDGVPSEKTQKEEFFRNNLFIPKNETPSGFQGDGLLLWASGRSKEESSALEEVVCSTFSPFLDLYSLPYTVTNRPWNWAGFAAPMAKAYLIGGCVDNQSPNVSFANDIKSVIDFNSMEASDVKMHNHNYINGANDLKLHATDFDKDGEPIFGHFSRHRTTWRGDIGYLLRSGGQEVNYNLSSFYKTDGTMGEHFINITKLLDLPEPKQEGQLLTLNDTVFFLSGNGDVFGYNDAANIWEVGDAHAALFHDARSYGKFLAASDKDRRAYISFDSGVFVKYNAIDSTFTTLGTRPQGEQWLISIF
jgi:PKD repeat protein